MKAQKPTSVQFHVLLNRTMVTNADQFVIAPSTLGVLAQMATSFELYRITMLKFRIHCNPSLTTSAYSLVGWVPDATVPSTADSGLIEVWESLIYRAGQTVPTEWCVISRTRLRGILEWYKANADAGASEFESQGVLNFYSTGATDLVTVEIRGVCEFKNPIDSGLALKRIKETVRKEVLDEMRSKAFGIEVAEVAPISVRRDTLNSPLTPKVSSSRMRTEYPNP